MGAAVGANIVLTFSENIQAGTGNIVLTPATGSAVTIDVTSSQGTTSTTAATINPTADLTAGVEYTVTTSAAGVFKDSASNNYAQLSGNTYKFTTASASTGTSGAGAIVPAFVSVLLLSVISLMMSN